MKKLCGILILLGIFVSSLCCLAACNNQQRLDTPSDVRIENDYLTWNKSEGADAYLVTINGNGFVTTDNKYDLLGVTIELTTYKMSVLALCDNNSQKDSLPSGVLVYQPKPAEGLFDYKQVSVGKKKGVMLLRKDDVPDDRFPDKLILPALAPNGSSVIALGNIANSVTKSVWIPNSVEIINYSAFENSENLERVKLPQRLTSIGASAFKNCKKLVDVVLPDSLSSLDSTAFNGCASLKEITFPAELKKFSYATEGVLNGCTSLEKIEVIQANPEKPGTLFAENGCLMSGTTLLKAVGNFAIPDTAETISYFAFSDNKSLTDLTIPDSVKVINGGAFARCSNLQSVNLGNNLTTISSSYYPIFAGCEKLASVTIPANVNTITGNMFMGCKALTSVNVAPENTTFKAINNFILSYNEKTVYCALSADNFPLNVKYIAPSAYAYSDIEQAVIPNGVSINERCFYSCKNLKTVSLPQGIAIIPDYAFINCYNLESINMPKSLKQIYVDAFKGALKLSLTLDGVSFLPLTPLAGTTVYTSGSLKNVQPYMSEGNLFANASISHDNNDAYVTSFTYYANGDNMSFSSTPVTLDGLNIGTHRAVPHRVGYTFQGWATSQNGSPVYLPYTVTPDFENMTPYQACLSDEEIASLSDGTTLYAVWKAA